MSDAKQRKTPRPERPYGGAGVDERAATMRGDLTDDELAVRNAIPLTNPAGGPHRVIAEERFVENDEATHYRPSDPDEPGPASREAFKAGVAREAQKITDRVGHKVTREDPDYWGLVSVMTDEEAEVTKVMDRRKPMTLGQLV